MKHITGLSLFVAAALGTMTTLSAPPAFAAPNDYRFEAVSPHAMATSDAKVAVRLVHIPDNKPVADAVIFNVKMEMPMAGMAPMTTKISSLRSTTPGEYPFQADLSAGGAWNLVLSAKVQGEADTVTGSVPFMTMK